MDSTGLELDFYGTLMEGIEICLFTFCDLDLTDAEMDTYYNSGNERDFLIDNCLVEDFKLDEFDDIPGMSDVRYGYRWCDDVETTKVKMRAAILKIVRGETTE